MLRITIPAREIYNEKTNEFINYKSITLTLEHSLVSISKWESRWKKAFLSKDEKTSEQVKDYIKCMTITQNVNDEIYNLLTGDNLSTIYSYINDTMTATIINNKKNNPNREIITSEIIYYWMVALQVPVEFQKWHLNRLLTLINVINIKNSPKKKMSKNEILSRNRRLNEERKRKYNTKG